MKVLQINSVCGIGSTGRIATDIHNILIKQGNESYIAYGREHAMGCETAIKIGTKYDTYAHVALTRVYDKHGFGSKKATTKLVRKIKQINPDIIHLHNIHGYYINIEILFRYLKIRNKPVVWTLHDCWAFTGHCSYFDYINCDKWKRVCNECPQKKEYPRSILIDNSRNNFLKKKSLFTGLDKLTIVTPSKWLAGLVRESFLAGYPVKVISNGINLKTFQPVESDFRKRYKLEGKFLILGVASMWEKRKGYKYFLELSKNLKEEEAVVLVGLTQEQKEQLPDNILGITRTNNIQELAEIYSTADVFVNPTLEEVMGLTNVEALACGTPVITFKTGGSVECVDNSCGIVVEKGSIEGLQKAIKRIKLGEFDEKSCIKKSREFDEKNKFGEYIELYQKYLRDEK